MEINGPQENYVAGWTKVYRSFIDWEWYHDSKTVHLFIHCILKANHKDNKWQGQLIKKGSFITSLNTLALETGISTQSIRTILKRLETTKEIIVKSTNKNRVISICNYDSYQEINNDANKQLTNNQQTTNKQLTTNKNVKNDKNLSYPGKEDDLKNKEKENNINGAVYSKSNFIDNWNTMRNHYLKTPSNFNKIGFSEETILKELISKYNKEEFQLALKGLFKQESMPKEIMWLNPKHLLNNFETYLDAEKNKKYKLYA